MSLDYSIRDYQITEPTPATVYLPADKPCDQCGEDKPLSEHGECADCEAQYHRDPEDPPPLDGSASESC